MGRDHIQRAVAKPGKRVCFQAVILLACVRSRDYPAQMLSFQMATEGRYLGMGGAESFGFFLVLHSFSIP